MFVLQSVIVGEHRGYWSPEAAPFQTLFTIVGDSLTFKYDGNVSLFSFPSKVICVKHYHLAYCSVLCVVLSKLSCLLLFCLKLFESKVIFLKDKSKVRGDF